MKAFTVSAAIYLALIAGACSQTAHVSNARILAFGVYEARGERLVIDTNAVACVVNVHREAEFMRVTTNIHAAIGLKFGVEFVLEGPLTNAPADIAIVKHYPQPGILPPGDTTPVLKSDTRRTVRIGEPTGVGYGFDDEWEIVPGVWTFEIWHEGRMLLRQSFLVERSSDPP